MNTEELAEFIRNNVPTFTNIRMLGAGVAFHYTDHFTAIQTHGGFLGAPISADMDHTQNRIPSIPANDPDGVVFAYQAYADAQEEGSTGASEVVEIEFTSALLVTHSQETLLGAPDTVVVLAREIIGFRLP